jgi:hypothetical protein
MRGKGILHCYGCDKHRLHKWYHFIPSYPTGQTKDLEFDLVDEEEFDIEEDFIEDFFYIARCVKCFSISIYFESNRFYPSRICKVEEPYPEMPEDIKSTYIEASSILELSPRASLALIRFALEKYIVEHLKYENIKTHETLNDKIIRLVDDKNLSGELKANLNILKNFGNLAAHSSLIDTNLDKDEAYDYALNAFYVLNNIIFELETTPNISKKSSQKLKVGYHKANKKK